MTTELLEAIARNRFMPAPPAELAQCGDGDFRAIGAEFLGHFIRLGELAPAARVLDIGCGVGRMAVPLTQFLCDDGSYDGIDIEPASIAWASRTITPVYPNFRFRHLDVVHPLYHAAGRTEVADVVLPYPDASYDFIMLISVFTHLHPAGLARYASEVARLLARGGRCFATAFLLNAPARAALRGEAPRIAFAPDEPGPALYADPGAPLAAVAFDEDFFLEKFLRVGLCRRSPATYGHWSGRSSPIFQDICIFERAAA